MKIYIAGKITGDPDYRAKFAETADALREAGAADVILNPAELPEGMTPGDYMRICFAMIDTADEVVFLPGWPASAGASVERVYCAYIGKPVRSLSEYGIGGQPEEVKHEE